MPYREEEMQLKRNYPDDDIDFPCAPCWVSHYAARGLTRDYPPEFYFPDNSGVEREIAELRREVEELSGKRVIYKYLQPLTAETKWKGFDV